jgi:tripartite ATP-independent transporter DctP family solute receptor
MNMKKLGSLLLPVSLMLAIVGCGTSTTSSKTQGTTTTAPTAASTAASTAPSTAAAGTPITIKLGHGTTTKSLYHVGSQKFKELVEAKSNGQIKVNIFSDGTIGQDNELVNFLKTGNVQMGMIGVEPLNSIAPKLKTINLPYIFADRKAAYTVLDGKLGTEMVAGLPAQGLRVIGYFENGFRVTSNSKHEVLTPANLKGLKIRTPQSPVSLSIFKALGSNPTPMPFGELYAALEQKTVDGQENPLANIYSNNLHEVQKFISITNHIYSPMVLAISEKTWTQMTPEQQKIVQEASNEARDYERKVSTDEEADYVSKLEKAGVKISKPDLKPFIEATKDVHLEFDKEYGEDFYKAVIAATKS